ncbi:MAG: VOC family protein [Nitrolancea sp.]
MSTDLCYGLILEYVTDIPAAKTFMVDVLGLEVERDSPVFVQFKDRNGVAFAIASDESLSGTGEREVYWVTDDAETAVQRLSQAAKVSVPLDQKPFGKVFGINDPAGQTHFIIEFAGSRPSQAVT